MVEEEFEPTTIRAFRRLALDGATGAEVSAELGLTVAAAAILALESIVFVSVHVKYREIPPIIMSGALGLVMAFIAYGRMVLQPIW